MQLLQNPAQSFQQKAVPQSWLDSAFEKLQPTLREFEKKRLHLNKLKRCVLLLFIGVVIFSAASLYLKLGFLIVAGLLGGFLVAYGFILGVPITKYKKSYRELVIPDLVRAISPHLHYKPNQGVSEEIILASGPFAGSAYYKGEDLIYGKIGKTPFFLSEILMWQNAYKENEGRAIVRKSGIFFRKDHDPYRFFGLMFVADFNKHFQGQTYVLPEKNSKRIIPIPKETDRVQLDDPEFERYFSVHTTDPIECRYILSHSLMRRLSTICQQFENPNMSVSFRNSMIWVGLPFGNHLTGSFLDPDIREPATHCSQLRKFVKEIEALVGLVEEMNLNTRIWTKH